MLALEMTDVRGCMAHLLQKGTFDRFLLSEAAITTMVTYTIDGHLVQGFYTDEEWEQLAAHGFSCIPFGRVRNICLDMIRGKKTPVSFKFVFLAPPAVVAELVEKSEVSFQTSDVEALSLNLTFRDGRLTATTGTSIRIFSMDKSLEQAWDAWNSNFLSDNKIEWSKLM